MSQLPPDNSDSQQPADDSSQNQQADNVVQGNHNRVVQGDNNKVIQGDNNVFNKTLNFFFNLTRQNNSESQNVRNPIQQKLLKIVNTEVESRINSSLHNRVYVVLDKEQNPYQVESPWEMEVKVGSQPKIRLQNTEITTVFDREEIAGRLLILGQPGSGKTTMLLKLAEELIKRAKDNYIYPVPVLLSLSAWKKDNPNIKDWLVEQLKDKYGVRKDIGKQWVDNQEIILLLDGLDEIAAERQELCVRKINDFLHPKNWSNPLVVCSRMEEYQRIASLLQLNSSLELFPFTLQHVYQYLQNTGNLKLWNGIKNDEDLNQLAQIPLFLNIIVLSAREISIETWQQFNTDEERHSYLFEAYISRMLKRPYKGKPLQYEKTKLWLCWLAQRLVEENTTEFLIEEMQPYWLKSKFQIVVYNIFVWGVILGLSFGLIFGLSGLILVLSFGLISGLSGLMLGLDGLIDALIYGLIYGLILGLIFGLILGISGVFPGFFGEYIQTIESFKFSLKKSFSGLIYGLISGLNFGLFIGLNFGLIWGLNGLIDVLISGLSFGLIIGLIIGLINGIVGVEVENKKIPNQGIYQSFINALFISFGVCIIATLLIVIFLITFQISNINELLVSSLFLGLFFGIFRGGTAVIKHFVLRVVLWSNGYIPWNYAKFLDYSTNRLFLQRVGGGYRFIHKMLQDHFAQIQL